VHGVVEQCSVGELRLKIKDRPGLVFNIVVLRVFGKQSVVKEVLTRGVRRGRRSAAID
jgi:hypothetical protein